MTVQVGSIGLSGERTTLAGKSQISERRELKASATSVDCRPQELGIGSKFRRAMWDLRARQSAAWHLVFTEKNQPSSGIDPARRLEHRAFPCRYPRPPVSGGSRPTPAITPMTQMIKDRPRMSRIRETLFLPFRTRQREQCRFIGSAGRTLATRNSSIHNPKPTTGTAGRLMGLLFTSTPMRLQLARCHFTFTTTRSFTTFPPLI